MIDLHCHSTCSDGSDTPAELVALAARTGLSAIALTDHDTQAGIAAARASAGDLGVRLVPGCEVSCTWSSGTLHMLSYFLEPGEGPLQDELVRLAADRAARNDLMLERLAALGLPISRDEVEAEAGDDGVIGRPHFAAVLVRKGAAESIQDAFDRLIGKGTPGYVSKARVAAGEIVDKAAASGAVAVLAHPLSLGLEGPELASAIGELAAKGLGGLECVYASYDEPTRNALRRIAGDLGLVPTGGSDYHGTYKPGLLLGTGRGDLDVADSVLDALEARCPTT
jgi:predicted metal-dependent phosphoesterase TrpH